MAFRTFPRSRLPILPLCLGTLLHTHTRTDLIGTTFVVVALYLPEWAANKISLKGDTVWYIPLHFVARLPFKYVEVKCFQFTYTLCINSNKIRDFGTSRRMAALFLLLSDFLPSPLSVRFIHSFLSDWFRAGLSPNRHVTLCVCYWNVDWLMSSVKHFESHLSDNDLESINVPLLRGGGLINYVRSIKSSATIEQTEKIEKKSGK